MSEQPRSIRGSADPRKLKKVEKSETVHHEQSGKKRKKPNKMGDMNLTAMLDVCFQLLIFFILTASFTVGEGILPAFLPFGQGPESQDDEPPEQPLNIVLSSAGGDDIKIMLEGSADALTSFNQLHARLKGLRRTVYDAKSPVNIRPDATVPWKHVVNCFNQAFRAKFENINFAEVQ